MEPQVSIVLCTAVVALAYYIFRLALPKPIPGIPHNPNLGLFGDIPALKKYNKDTQQVYRFLTDACSNLGSPIVQLFARPFGKPWVIVSDPDVAYDVLMRRSPSEFDRSTLFKDILHGLVPNHHVRMNANDVMKSQKRLMSETMSPSFLHDVASEKLHSAILGLMELWRLKAEIAGPERAFVASFDVKHAMLDGIWNVAMGWMPGTTASQIEGLRNCQDPLVTTPASSDDTVVFREFEVPPLCRAMETMDNSVDTTLSSPFPKQHHWLLRRMPGLSAALKVKERTITENLTAAKARAERGEEQRSAADLVIGRAMKTTKIDISDPILRDELFGFLAAGHDISATTIAWALKHLSNYQQIQTKLREAVQSEFASIGPKKIPEAAAIAKANIPYLEAFVEEVGRCTAAQPGTSRCVVKDGAQLMGFPIPAGTDVFFMTDGPGYLSRPIRAPELDKDGIKRWPTTWKEEDLDKFMPERWLVEKEDGKVEFDVNAGPCHPFGLGMRGCFGKKLASVEMRVFFAILIASFELLPVPDRWNGYQAWDKLNHNPKYSYVRLRAI
ncbi:MAG: hypothetical protein Q9184_006547 [Pyrenodesmia sp. 2 TL-2023]